MSICNDRWIYDQCQDLNLPLIKPFYDTSRSQLPNGQKVPSFGLSSFGYDVSLGNKFTPFRSLKEDQVYTYTIGDKQYTQVVEKAQADSVIDVCNFYGDLTECIYNVDTITIPPGGFMLGVTNEYFNMRRNTLGICTGKSTVARSALHVVVTPAEPGWSGYLTLEIQNMSALPVKLTSGMGITQLVFIAGSEPHTSYADRDGKYQNQGFEPVLPRQK